MVRGFLVDAVGRPVVAAYLDAAQRPINLTIGRLLRSAAVIDDAHEDHRTTYGGDVTTRAATGQRRLAGSQHGRSVSVSATAIQRCCAKAARGRDNGQQTAVRPKGSEADWSRKTTRCSTAAHAARRVCVLVQTSDRFGSSHRRGRWEAVHCDGERARCCGYEGGDRGSPSAALTCRRAVTRQPRRGSCDDSMSVRARHCRLSRAPYRRQSATRSQLVGRWRA